MTVQFFYDTEFIENGREIELISIGIVSSRGDTYYAVNSNIELGNLYGNIIHHKFLMENVIPQLPIVDHEPINQVVGHGHFSLDLESPYVMPKLRIANQIRQFLTQYNEPIELWAYYGACDHMALMWLWGPISARPDGIPMITFDLLQWAHHLGLDDSTFPRQIGKLHNALEDAKWNQEVFRYLKKVSFERFYQGR